MDSNVLAFSCLFIVQPLITPPRLDDSEASASTKALLGALALNGIILAAEITAFTYMRRYFRLIYEPRCLSFFEL